ncbi:glycerophosphoryl diester phosphodiesterase [Virgisporangium aliadipatigenens]|uniref:glycerophosphodiester phosphodiesterase n=1 Tax=Virgisporangium aliadipatigenens TaxID=741659 RepID=A0A8J3YDU9_9ACTN|nr:glycerophosphoryl diester phosphodiesterase [Virgisporangium aliadipatigenens]
MLSFLVIVTTSTASVLSTRPLVIGHRGASGYLPEHTLAAYELAVRLGADCIEPDLVPTIDGLLVARHDAELSRTTDVATRAEFAGRSRAGVVDGEPHTGWFAEDFTAAELATLRAVERMPALRPANTAYNGRFPVATFDEVLDLRARLSAETGRTIGVYLEAKHPHHYRGIGVPVEEPVVAALRRHGLDAPDAPVFVQSFCPESLVRFHALGLTVPLVFLAESSGTPVGDPRTYEQHLSAAGLRELRAFVAGIGPQKDLVIPRRPDGTLGAPTELVERAHALGMFVHAWTFRAENRFLPADLRLGAAPQGRGRAVDELRAFLAAGVDGIFTDQPDVGVLARDRQDGA